MLATIFHFLAIVVICITALVALTLVLMALPNSPIRDFMLSFVKRVGMTTAAVAMVPPMDVIPVSGEIYDLIALAVVVYYWYTFFQEQQAKMIKPSNTIVIPTLPQQLKSGDQNHE